MQVEVGLDALVLDGEVPLVIQLLDDVVLIDFGVRVRVPALTLYYVVLSDQAEGMGSRRAWNLLLIRLHVVFENNLLVLWLRRHDLGAELYFLFAAAADVVVQVLRGAVNRQTAPRLIGATLRLKV